MTAHSSLDDDPEPLSAAARWHDHLSGASPDRAAFDAWIAASPENAIAYERVQRSWASARALADRPEILAIRHETLARAVLRRSRPSYRLAGAGMAAAALLSVCTALWIVERNDASRTVAALPASMSYRTFSTKIGERLDVTLEDGSRLSLDTDTTVKLRFMPRLRELALEKGQALFEVAKAPQRPFTVAVGDRTVTAYGTKFNIRRDQDTIAVALIKGSVGVRRRNASVPAILVMHPNEQLVAKGERQSLTRYANLDRIVSWKDGIVQFDNASVSYAVNEINRYLVTPIGLDDSRVGAIRISGSFPTGSSAAFLEAVQVTLPIRVERDRSGKPWLRYRPAS